MSQEIKDYLKNFIPFVDFIAGVVGNNSEIVLHDLTNLDASVIAIRNNHITGRTVGAPATDFVLKILKENRNDTRDFILNYKGINKNSNIPLRSSSLFIRYNGQLVGMLCVNTDATIFHQLEESIHKLFSMYNHDESANHENHEEETFATSIEEMAELTIQAYTNERMVSVEYLKPEEKIDIMTTLWNQGFFLLKGAVAEIAKKLKISEPTVYRYLQGIKECEHK